MRICHLKLVNFRNYTDLDLDFHRGINIFIGLNAQGKTNILESIYYASAGNSYRSHGDEELIKWESSGGSISLDFERAEVGRRLNIIFPRDKRRKLEYDGNVIAPKDLVGALNVVLFSPDDLLLIKGAPNGRRAFLDREISQANPAYYKELLKYNHLLQQRNLLLKNIRDKRADKSLLELWDIQLAESAAKITKKRLEAVKKFNMLANLMQRRISGNEENLQISYILKHGEGKEIDKELNIWYNEMLSKLTEQDIFKGNTSVGPHRDDIAILVNGIDLKSFGSQGQQRTGVLALKLSELEFIRSETGEYPILLLDDVMSELDGNRRNQLLNFIKREKIQTVITATEKAYFSQEQLESYFQVEMGRVKRVGR